MTDKTIRDLDPGIAIQNGDLFITRQGTDTVDKSVTAAQIRTHATALLGDAATATLTSGQTDVTTGRVLKVGDFGYGNNAVNAAGLNANDILIPGMYSCTMTTTGVPVVGNNLLVVFSRGTSFGTTTGTVQHYYTSTGLAFIRMRTTGSTWTNWNQISDADAIYVASRGQNLVTNGAGLIGNNRNFSQFTYDGAEAYSGRGSFRATGQQQTLISDELIPVNTDEKYRFTTYVKWAGSEQPRFYAGLAFYDSDGLMLNPQFHMRLAGTETTLAQPLKPGDTVVYLTSAAGWNNSADANLRRLLIFGYKNSGGYTYPPYTYSRHLVSDAWLAGGIDYINNTITLRVPLPTSVGNPDHPDGEWPIGHPVCNTRSGGTYKYITANNVLTPPTWTKFEGFIQGVDLSGTNNTFMFPPGTASAKMLFLTNRNTATAQTTWFSNLELSLVTATPPSTVTVDAIPTYADTAGFRMKNTALRVLGNSLNLPEVTPAAPPAGTVSVHGINSGGRMMPGWRAPSGISTEIQASLAKNKIALINPVGGNTTVSVLGVEVSTTGSVVAAGLSTASIQGAMRRIEYAVTTPATDAVGGWRSTINAYHLGASSTPYGGFYMCWRFGLGRGTDALAAGTIRGFTGISSITADPSDANPSTTLTNAIGVGCDSTDVNYQIIHRTGTGAATKINTGIPKNDSPVGNEMYELILFTGATVGGVGYKFTRLSDATSVSGTITTNLPTDTQLLSPRGYYSVGGTLSDIAYTLASFYAETDY